MQSKPAQDRPAIADERTIVSSSHANIHNYAYYQEIFRGQRLPLAYLDLDLFDENVRQVVARASGKRIRVASKSLRCIAAIQRILEADECFQGVMSFTAREAVHLAKYGIQDIVMGYPVWHEQDIVEIARATAEGAQITLMVDSVAHVEQIEKVARQQGVRLPLCLEIDMSLPLPGLHFGVWRSPVHTGEEARPVIERIQQAEEHVWLDGVMGYEAQIAGVGDAFRGQGPKNTLVSWLKKRSRRDVAERRARLVDIIASYGITLRFVNGGGTGSILSTREEAAVSEITVGSGFYAPTLFDNYRDFRYLPAAGFAIEIVRQPGPAIHTCLGGGYIASGATGKEKLPQPYLPLGARLDALEGAGEVQTPIHYSGEIALQLGDPIFLRHAKAGELCERFIHLLLVSNGKIVDEVPTYRGEGQCFL